MSRRKAFSAETHLQGGWHGLTLGGHASVWHAYTPAWQRERPVMLLPHRRLKGSGDCLVTIVLFARPLAAAVAGEGIR